MANAVSLKLPEFWEHNANAWFTQAEAQFALRDMTVESAKYYHVVAALSNSKAGRVVSLLECESLKAHLKVTFGLSESERDR